MSPRSRQVGQGVSLLTQDGKEQVIAPMLELGLGLFQRAGRWSRPLAASALVQHRHQQIHPWMQCDAD